RANLMPSNTAGFASSSPLDRSAQSRALSAARFPSFVHEKVNYAFFAVGLLLAMGAFTPQLAGVDPRIARQLDEGSLISQGVLGTIYLVATIILLRNRIALPMLARAWPIFLLPILAIVSATWSPDPSLTLRRGFALVGTILFALSLASVFDFQSCLRLFIQVLVIAVVLSIFWALVFPASGIHQVTDAVEP